MDDERTIIIGGPRTGKSWLAREMASERGISRYCGDPRSLVKEPFEGVIYLPEGLAMEDMSTRWIVDNWFQQDGPWICEGWIMARALRKWLQTACLDTPPADRVIVFQNQRNDCSLAPGQIRMHKGVMGVWDDIEPQLPSSIDIEYR